MIENAGAQGRNRTTDTRIFSPLLYQLSYLAGAATHSEDGAGIRPAVGKPVKAPGTAQFFDMPDAHG